MLSTATGSQDMSSRAGLACGSCISWRPGSCIRWRATVAGRIAGISARVGPVALGVAAGLVLGQLASLAGTGLGATGGLDHPAWLLVSAALGAGAAALSAGLAEPWADAVPRLHRRMAMAAMAVIDGLSLASALWIGSTRQFALDAGGPTLARAWLVTLLPSASLIVATVAVLALAAVWALWARTAGAAAPAWVTEGGNRPAWPSAGLRARHWVPAALATGIAAEGSLATFRFIAGPPASLAIQAERYYLYVWVTAAAGAVCALTLGWLNRARGVGVACLAAPLATLTAVAGWLAVNTALGAQLSVRFVVTVAQTPLALGLLFGLAAALAGLIPAAARPQKRIAPGRIRLAQVLLLPAGCAVAVSALIITGRGAIAGPSATLVPGSSAASSAVPAARLGGLRYLNRTAPAIEAAYAPARRSIVAASAAPSPGAAAALIQAEVLPRLRTVLRQAEAVR